MADISTLSGVSTSNISTVDGTAVANISTISGATRPSGGSEIPTTGLLARYTLNGNSNDSVGSNDGTDTDVTYTTPSGASVQVASFNGSTSRIEIASYAGGVEGNTFGYTDDYSICYWAYVDNFTSQNRMVLCDGYSYTSTNGRGIWEQLRTDKDHRHLVFFEGITRSIIDTAQSSISTGTWYWFCTERDASAGTITTYRNNSQIANTTGLSTNNVEWTQPVGVAGKTAIGANFNSGSWINDYDGYISDLIIYNRPLGSTDRTTIYNLGVTNLGL